VREGLFNISQLARNLSVLSDPVAQVRSAFRTAPDRPLRASGFKLMYQQATAAELDVDHRKPGPSPAIANAIATVATPYRR
jgi:hypothetical protein